MSGPTISDLESVSRFFGTSKFKIVDYKTKKEFKPSRQTKKRLDRNRTKKLIKQEDVIKTMIKKGQGLKIGKSK